MTENTEQQTSSISHILRNARGLNLSQSVFYIALVSFHIVPFQVICTRNKQAPKQSLSKDQILVLQISCIYLPVIPSLPFSHEFD